MTQTQPNPNLPAANLTQQQKKLAFYGILSVLFLASINMTVVGSAMPRVISELGGFSLYAWAFTAYSLVTTIVIPIAGTVSDRLGRRPLLLFGIAVFSAGSMLLGLSASMEMLIALRAVQAVGGGVLMAMAFTAIADIFTPRERGKYQGYTGAVWGISSVVGPLLGGFLTDHVGWRSVFYVNVPFAALAGYFIYQYFRVPPANPGADKHIDYLGVALLTAAVSALTLVASWGGVQYAWNSPTIAGLAAGAVAAIAAYTWHALRIASPIVNLRLLRLPTMSIGSVAGFLTSAGMFAAIMYLPLYMQGVRGTSATISGLALVPLMGGMVLSSTLSGQLVSRWGRYKWVIVVGALVAGVFGLGLGALGLTTPMWWAAALMVGMGVGLGAINAQLTLGVQNAAPAAQVGGATGSLQFYRQIGGTLAVGLYGTLVNAHVAANMGAALPAGVKDLPARMQAQVGNPNLLSSPDAIARLSEGLDNLGKSALIEPLLLAERTVMAGALSEVFLWSGALLLGAFAASLFLPDLPLSGGPAPASPHTQPGNMQDKAQGRKVAAGD